MTIDELNEVNTPENEGDEPVVEAAPGVEAEAKTSAEATSETSSPATRGGAGRSLLTWVFNLLGALLLATAAFLAYQRFTGQGLSISLDSIRAKAPVKEVERAQAKEADAGQSEAAPPAAQTAFEGSLPPLATPSEWGVMRRTNLDTRIPPRERTDVITYTVKMGDNLFAIADQYGLKPETILWGNFESLQDNANLLSKDQKLNILPVNGAYYQWKEGDTLQSVADFFKVTPEEIAGYSGNDIDLTLTAAENYGIKPGQWIIVKDGKRPIKDWGPPAISRENPAVARYYGEGACGSVYEGAIGTGGFVWPTSDHSISGYTYTGIHPALDIGGAIGNGIFAADSGVVVFAGWSSHGYGYLVVIDHGNGWQTAYAHMSAVAVTCGQSVFQGGYIGAIGSTGNSSGPHLHFEMIYNGGKPNPLDYIR